MARTIDRHSDGVFIIAATPFARDGGRGGGKLTAGSISCTTTW